MCGGDDQTDSPDSDRGRSCPTDPQGDCDLPALASTLGPRDPRRLLSLPVAYRWFSILVGAHRSRTECVARYIRPQTSDRVLDCGCGPGDLREYLPDADYVGIDVDEKYIAEARSRFGDRATFRLGSLGPGTMTEESHYDLVLAWGVLHHLDDDHVREFMSLARRSLKPKGRLVTLDPCYVKDQSRVARYLLDKDRGDYVRQRGDWPRLVTPTFPSTIFHVRHDLLRIPYTHLIMECPAEAP